MKELKKITNLFITFYFVYSISFLHVQLLSFFILHFPSFIYSILCYPSFITFILRQIQLVWSSEGVWNEQGM
jgi:hypothetical protein